MQQYTPKKIVRFQIWLAKMDKTRPVLIVTNNRQAGNPRLDSITVIPMTSNMKHIRYSENVFIERKETTTKLPFECFYYGVVNMNQMTVISKTVLTTYVGRVKSKTKIELLNLNIKKYLGLK